MTTIYRPQRTSIAGKRARRIDRSIPVIPAVEEEQSGCSPDAAGELHRILAEALASTGEATAALCASFASPRPSAPAPRGRWSTACTR